MYIVFLSVYYVVKLLGIMILFVLILLGCHGERRHRSGYERKMQCRSKGHQHSSVSSRPCLKISCNQFKSITNLMSALSNKQLRSIQIYHKLDISLHNKRLRSIQIYYKT